MEECCRIRGLCKVTIEFHATIPHLNIRPNFERSRNMTTVDDAEKEKGSAAVAPILTSVSEADVSDVNQTGKVTLSACESYTSIDRWIQHEISLSSGSVTKIGQTLSKPRITRYAAMVNNDVRLALRLHTWNASVAASLLPLLHVTEVSIRNFALRRLMSFYGNRWYLDTRLIRKLGGNDSAMGKTLIRAYQDELNLGRTGDLTNYITSELPFGFWVNVFTSKFTNEIWNRPLHTYNTHIPRNSTLQSLHEGVDGVRKFRNSIAHHKNVVLKPVEENYEKTLDVLSWFCPPSSELARNTSMFPRIWACCPIDTDKLV